MAVTRGKGNQNVRKAQKSSQCQAIVVVVALFVLLFVLWTIIESNYGPITPEAIGKGLLLALPIPGLVAVTVFFSWRSRNRASARLLESFGLDAEKADLSDPAWFVTKDYPPVLLHESMFSRDKAVAYHKETIEPGAHDLSISEEYYAVNWVDARGEKRTCRLPGDDAISADRGAIKRFKSFCKRWGITLCRAPK